MHAVLAFYNTSGLTGEGACCVTGSPGGSVGATLCVGQGDLPGWETPGGFSKALPVYLDQLYHQLTLVKAEVEPSLKATFETPMVGNQCPAAEPGGCVSLRRGEAGTSSKPDALCVPKSRMASGREYSPVPACTGICPNSQMCCKDVRRWQGQRGTRRFAV